MAGMQVEKIKVGELDSAGNRITAVYAKVSGTYAIYCTGEHVMVHFSDDEQLGAEQRLCLVSLHDMRGTIDELSSDLLLQGDKGCADVVSDIRRQMAFALQIALQGQKEIGLLKLTRLHARLVDQKQSSARLYYLASTLVILLAVMLLSWIATSPLFVEDPGRNEPINLLWIAFSVGGVGAFFSIVIAIRSRKIRSATILRDNLIDAGLRVLVGSLSAVILVDLVYLQAARLEIGGLVFSDNLAWPHVLILGIFAGFFERFVPDMLDRMSNGNGAAAESGALAATHDLTGALRDETSPLRDKVAPASANGSPSSPVHDEGLEMADAPDAFSEEVDGCCDQPIDADSDLPVTDDVELPPADGGVEAIIVSELLTEEN